MSYPGAARRRDKCLRNVAATSLYNNHQNIEMDQKIKFIPGLNDRFSDKDDPGDDVLAVFHTAMAPG